MSGKDDSGAAQGLYARWSPEALMVIGRLDFIAREVLDGVRQGLHRTMRRGFSSEFFDYKNYDPGDDAAKIDWRLYAKTGKFFIKRYEAETSLECMMLADLSPSMSWRWRDCITKREYAAMLAASLGLLFVRQRDHVGLHSFGTLPVRHLNAKCSNSHLDGLFSALGSGVCTVGGPDLRELSRGITSIQRHRGLLILLSDLEMPREELSECLSLLRARGDELIVFHILDKAEVSLPFDSATHIQDSETGEIVPFSSGAKGAHERAVAAFRDFVKSECLSVGAACVALDTSVSCVEAILSMVRERKELA